MISAGLDLQDALILVGIASIVGGVAMWSRPAALVVFGVFCLVVVRLIQIAKNDSPQFVSGKGRG